MMTENRVQVQLQLHLQGHRSTYSKKSCDSSKFQECLDKYSGDTWKWLQWVWNGGGGGGNPVKGQKGKILKSSANLPKSGGILNEMYLQPGGGGGGLFF